MSFTNAEIMEHFFRAVQRRAAFRALEIAYVSADTDFWKSAVKNMPNEAFHHVTHSALGDHIGVAQAASRLKAQLKEEQTKDLDRLIVDPFYALRIVKGDLLANAVLSIAKSKYLKRLRLNSNLWKGAERSTLTRYDDAISHVLEELRPLIIDEEAQTIFLKKISFSNYADSLMRYFSPDEIKRFKYAMSFVNGKVEAGVLKGNEVHYKHMGSYYREVVAAETGQGAQDKNPLPRRGNSSPKMNRPTDP